MFNCSVCNKPSAPNTPATVVVVETRPKTYYNYGPKGGLISTTYGEEIVKEELVCSTCNPLSLPGFNNTLAPALRFIDRGVVLRTNE